MSTNQFRFSSTNLFSHLLFFIGIFSCIPVLRIGYYSIYVWLMALAVPLLIITGRFRMRRTPLMPLLFSACITFFFTYSTLPEAYGENNFKGLLSILLVFIVSASLLLDSKDSERVISGVLIAGKINIIWIFLQTIFWGILKTDLNDLVFNQTLHMVENASQYKASGLVSTGLCWNAGGIAAAIILVFAFESVQWKILALISGFLTQSSTTIIGVVVVMLFFFFQYITSEKIKEKIKLRNFLISFTIIGMGISLLVFVPKIQSMLDKVIGTSIDRLNMIFNEGSQLDSSAAAHFNYYSNLPDLIHQMNSGQLFFGHGIDCSGLPYTKLTRQYFWLDSWFLESDIANTFLGMGLLGITSLYFFLFYIAVKRWADSKIVFIVILSYIICGYFYDVQSVTYYWLLFIEFALLNYKIHMKERKKELPNE
ncbi:MULTISPECIES: hypothetical protein [Bifidobacterium]|uniref:hypothetical protein n=1 Tax=Bifidobacterium TaxID=1678 RepID=UPI0010F86D0E|nr:MULTISPECIES: hypothetical protein [Bifidobacterium]MBF9692834.1 hypothetical protein [Bifidobacterium dentium]MBF9697369.1 hypothetical protein [Bifidobacterium dentium]